LSADLQKFEIAELYTQSAEVIHANFTIFLMKTLSGFTQKTWKILKNQ